MKLLQLKKVGIEHANILEMLINKNKKNNRQSVREYFEENNPTAKTI